MPKHYPAGVEPVLSNVDLPDGYGKLLSKGMQLVAANSQFEAAAGGLMSALLGVGNRAGAVVYSQLRSAKHQGMALKEVAAFKMADEDQKRLSKLLSYAADEAIFRDMLAHGLWVYDDKIPDAAIIIEGHLSTRFIAGDEVDDILAGATIWDFDTFDRHIKLSGELFLAFNSMIPLAYPKEAAPFLSDWRKRVDASLSSQADTVKGMKQFLKAHQGRRK